MCSLIVKVGVSNFETAMGVMMMKEGVSDLRETEAWIDMPDSGIKKGSDESNVKNFVTKIGKHLVINNTILDSYEYYSESTCSSQGSQCSEEVLN